MSQKRAHQGVLIARSTHLGVRLGLGSGLGLGLGLGLGKLDARGTHPAGQTGGTYRARPRQVCVRTLRGALGQAALRLRYSTDAPAHISTGACRSRGGLPARPPPCPRRLVVVPSAPVLTGESVTSAASTAINVSSLGRTPGEPVGAPDRRSGVLSAAFGGRCCLLLLRPWITLAHVLVQLSVAAHKAERLEDLLVATDVLEPLELILGERTRHRPWNATSERANATSARTYTRLGGKSGRKAPCKIRGRV